MKTYILILTGFFSMLTNQGITQENLINSKPLIPSKAKSPTNFIQLPNGHSYTASKTGIKMWDNFGDIRITTENSNIPENNVTALALDRNENLWIGTQSSGIVVGNGDPVKPFRTHTIVTHEQNVYSIYTDPQGYVWITYQNGGVECFRNGISIAYYPYK